MRPVRRHSPGAGGVAGGRWLRLSAWGPGGPDFCRCPLWFSCPNRCASYLLSSREVSSTVSPCTSAASSCLPSAPTISVSGVVLWGGLGGAERKWEGGDGGSAEAPAWGRHCCLCLPAAAPPRGSSSPLLFPAPLCGTPNLSRSRGWFLGGGGGWPGTGRLPQSRISCPSPALPRAQAALIAWRS